MNTIALRFGDQFAPECGTISAHQDIINELGYVWYGKMGNPVSDKIIDQILLEQDKKILLIHSGKTDRYWAYISEISKETPPAKAIPSYYRDMTDKFRTWFKVTRFETAPKNIMAKCRVTSSGSILGEVSKHSMSPYFIISYTENEQE